MTDHVPAWFREELHDLLSGIPRDQQEGEHWKLYALAFRHLAVVSINGMRCAYTQDRHRAVLFMRNVRAIADAVLVTEETEP